MRQLASDSLLAGLAIERADYIIIIKEKDSPEGSLVRLGLGYLGLVCLAFYIDYRMQLRRARKRREKKEVLRP